MSRVRLILMIFIAGVVGSLCLVTAGDASMAVSASLQDVTRQSAVLEQHLVVVEAAGASGSPRVAESAATSVATSYLATSNKATSVQARYVILTVRNEDGHVAWGIQARPVWLLTFQGVGYPLASASAGDCSCAAYYWRPNTAVAVDAQSGEVLLRMGVAS